MDASLKRTMKHQSLGSQCSFQCIICLERLDQPSSSELPTVGDEQNQANEQIQPSNENNFAQPGPSRANGSNVGVGARDPNSVSLCTIDKKIIVATACGHMFHLLCIELWFSKKSNRNCCPLCDHVKDQKIMRLYPNASAGSEQRPMTNVTETPPGAGLSPSLDGNTAPVIIPEPTSSIGNIAPKRILARANRRVKDTSITGYVSGTDVINNAVSAGALVGNVTPFPLTIASSNIYNNGSAPTGFPTATLIRNNAPATAGADFRMNTNVAYPSCIPEFNLAPAAAFNFPMMDAINMVSQYHTSTCENIALMKAKGKARLEVEINRINSNTASLVSVLAEGYVAAINKDSMDTWLAKMDDSTARNIAKNRCITDLYTDFSRTTSVTSVTRVSNYLATNDSRVGLPVSNLAPGATFNFPMIEAINLVSQYHTSTCENIARMEAVDTADLKAEINHMNANTASLVSVLAEGHVASINKYSMDTWLAKMNECTARKIANNKNIADIYIARYRTTSVTSVIGVPNYLATNVSSRVGFPAPATTDVKTKRDIPYPPYIFLTNTVLVVSPIPPAKLVCELPTHILDATSRGFVNFMGSQYNTSTSESFARMKSVNTAYIEVEVNRINANTTSLKSVLMDGCFSSISHIVTRLAKMMEYTAHMIAANKSISDEYIARMNSVIRVPMSAHMAYDLSSMGNSGMSTRRNNTDGPNHTFTKRRCD